VGLQPEPGDILAIFDAQLPDPQIGPSYPFNGAHDLIAAKCVRHFTANRKSPLIEGCKIDPLRIVGFAPAIEDGGVGRRERKLGNRVADCVWEDVLEQPVVERLLPMVRVAQGSQQGAAGSIHGLRLRSD